VFVVPLGSVTECPFFNCIRYCRIRTERTLRLSNGAIKFYIRHDSWESTFQLINKGAPERDPHSIWDRRILLKYSAPLHITENTILYSISYFIEWIKIFYLLEKRCIWMSSFLSVFLETSASSICANSTWVGTELRFWPCLFLFNYWTCTAGLLHYEYHWCDGQYFVFWNIVEMRLYRRGRPKVSFRSTFLRINTLAVGKMTKEVGSKFKPNISKKITERYVHFVKRVQLQYHTDARN
jgi:hypothetical protein